MKLAAERLPQHLKGALARVYLVSGDEPLLCQEAADAIRAAAGARGFSERRVFNAERDFDWGQLLRAGDNLSLFSESFLLDVRLPSGKPGEQGTKALLEYLERGAEDSLLLLSLPKLDKATLASKWCKTLLQDSAAAVVQIWPVEERQLPQWIKRRLAAAGLEASQDAIELISARVEGNLLAASQEVEKLKLLADGAPIDLAKAQAVVAQSARFDLFGLVDTALGGAAGQALRMLRGLRAEGIDSTLILWGLAREIRLLASLAGLRERGIALPQAMAQQRPPVWEKRRPLLRRAVERQSADYWPKLLVRAQIIDEQIKGQSPGSPWSGLEGLVLGLAGRPLGQTPARPKPM